MPTIDVRNTRLYYEMDGEGKPALLIIHGTGAGAWIWEAQVQRLSSDFACVAYDRRGHSRSESGEEDQSYRTHVEDAAALINALGLNRPILVGNSAGGGIAIELLHRYPEIARGAVVSEPGLFSVQPGAEKEARNLIGPVIKRSLDEGGPRNAVDAFMQTVCSQFWSTTDEPTRERFRDNAPMFLASTSAQGSTATADDLSSINHPMLVVTGSESPQLLHKVARAVVEHLPNARSIEIEGSGHVTQVERPDEFARAVKTFVTEVAGSQASVLFGRS